jgi:hypothetical protein
MTTDSVAAGEIEALRERLRVLEAALDTETATAAIVADYREWSAAVEKGRAEGIERAAQHLEDMARRASARAQVDGGTEDGAKHANIAAAFMAAAGAIRVTRAACKWLPRVGVRAPLPPMRGWFTEADS